MTENLMIAIKFIEQNHVMKMIVCEVPSTLFHIKLILFFLDFSNRKQNERRFWNRLVAISKHLEGDVVQFQMFLF